MSRLLLISTVILTLTCACKNTEQVSNENASIEKKTENDNETIQEAPKHNAPNQAKIDSVKAYHSKHKHN